MSFPSLSILLLLFPLSPPVPRSIIEKARIKEKVGESEESILLSKQALALQSGNVECISMIAYHYFYLQFPEISLKFVLCAAHL